jgi:curved DNA-binding protein CbpA
MSTATDERITRRQPDFDETADLYAVLGVRYDATPVEITRAYRRAMRRNHPDTHPGEGREVAEQRARRINAAYATLNRTTSRRAYDQTLRAQVASETVMGRYVNGGFSPDDIGRARAQATQAHRRPLSPAEARDLRRANLATYVSLGIAFGGFLAGIVLVLVLLALVGALLRLVL